MTPPRLLLALASALPLLPARAAAQQTPDSASLSLIPSDEPGALWLLLLGVIAYLFAVAGHNRHNKH
ncbi:MAG: hypothetical protein QM803_20380 [Rhodocyclaceae bacterium]